MSLFQRKDEDEIVRPVVTSPTSDGDSKPLKDFLLLLVVIFTAPFIFLASFFTGRIRNPFVVVTVLLLIIMGMYYISKSGGISKRDIKTKIIQQTLEELTQEEKEELKNEISTLRESIDIHIVPPALYPIIDVPLDMLNINYLLFMIQSGYIQPDGSGSEFILDSYLHSSHKLLKEKSWEALQNIKTEAANRVLSNYEKEIETKNEMLKTKYGKPDDKSTIENIQYDIRDKIQNLKNTKPF